MDECVTILRKECSLDADFNMHTIPSEGISEDWTMFQNAFRLIQMCGKETFTLFTPTKLV